MRQSNGKEFWGHQGKVYTGLTENLISSIRRQHSGQLHLPYVPLPPLYYEHLNAHKAEVWETFCQTAMNYVRGPAPNS